jgi:hypothetical protein
MAPGFGTSHKSNDYSRYYFLMYEWLHRNKSLLLELNIINIIMLCFIHFFILTVQINPSSTAEKILQIITISLISIIALSIIWRGSICIAIGILGLSLIYAGILLPSYVLNILQDEKQSYPDGKNETSMLTIDQPIFVATQGFFFLGIAMVVLSMIIGYRPDLLYVRNRPEPLDTIWDKYPIWYDYNKKLVGRRYSEPMVHVKSLMTAEENYLVWRYEYILADVYDTPHLVKPDSYLPKSSKIFRDKESGKMIGKAKYIGYFV